MKKISAFVVMTAIAFSAFAQECTHHRQQGCQEFQAINAQHDVANPLYRGLEGAPASDLERVTRAESIGKALWQAQHQGAVQAAGPASFLVFVWNGGAVANPVGYSVTKDRKVMRYTAENVKGEKGITPSKLDGYGPPDAIYRIRTDGISASILLPRSVLNSKTFVIICREGKNGVYPNTIVLHQGQSISGVELEWYKWQPDGSRILVPFVSKS